MAVEVSSGSTWSITETSGGRFLTDFDPIIALDEEHLLLATRRFLNVYSISTSLLVRSIPIYKNASSIRFVALSPQDHRLAYVVDVQGKLTLWDWETGVQVYSFTYNHNGIESLAVAGSKQKERIFLAVKTADSGQTKIVLITRVVDSTTYESAATLKELEQPVVAIQAFEDALVIVSEKSVDIGVLNSKKRDREEEASLAGSGTYTWSHIDFNDKIHAFDILRRKQGKKDSSLTFDLVIGDSQGRLYMYNDIANRSASQKPQVYHWHRRPVNSVKWELDGNRILSGGQESVLSFFNTTTAKGDTLPHLTASILRITVSHTGKLYALHLADNSVLVLSATERIVRAAISGPQSHPFPATIPAASNPRVPEQILIAVPSHSVPGATTVEEPTSSFLQTFNIFTDAHVARQALSRANVTNINIAPKGGERLKDANVILLQMSHDGKWLATVDEWIPPASDLTFLAHSPASLLEEQKLRRQVSLKFWRWKALADGGNWVLETKIDQPHSLNEVPIAHRVLHLAASPRSLAFATIGEDATVRVWRPKTRLKNGTLVKQASQDGVTVWLVAQEVMLQSDLNVSAAQWSESSIPITGKVAFSDDETVLAAALDHDTKNYMQTSRVNLITANKSSSARILAPLFEPATLAQLAFIGRHLIAVSNVIRVHDVVDDAPVYEFGLGDEPNLAVRKPERRRKVRETSLLAVSRETGTFAVSSVTAKGEKSSYRIRVFKPTTRKPLHTFVVPDLVTALFPLPREFGFVAIDREAEIRMLRPDGVGSIGTSTLAIEQLMAEPAGRANGEAKQLVIEGVPSGDEMDIDAVGGAEDDSDGNEDHDDDAPAYKPLVTPEMLREALRNSGPTVRDMASSVWDLYLGKKGGKEAKKVRSKKKKSKSRKQEDVEMGD